MSPQIAHVVPIARVRRATTWWSYTVPHGSHCIPGSLVIVSLRGKAHLGIVWGTEEGAAGKLQPLERVITTQPLLRAPQRECIEWLSEYGLCSLSSALYATLPGLLRKFPLSKGAQNLLTEWDATTITAAESALRRQHVILTPNQRPEAEIELEKKYGKQFARITSEQSELETLRTWLSTARGEIRVGSGREGALFSPWVNLRHMTLVNPEDISFYHEQIPYLNLVDAARAFSHILKSDLQIRTYLPQAVGSALWGENVLGTQSIARVEITEIGKEGILGKGLISAIQATLASNKTVVILYNAHDRLQQQEDGTRTVIPGIETLAKRLAVALNVSELPSTVILGTRTILTKQYIRVGLTVLLSADPLLAQDATGDRIHGWADLGRLLSLSEKCIIQTKRPAHPMIEALRQGTFIDWCLTELSAAKTQGQPPFIEQIVCSISENSASRIKPGDMYSRLESVERGTWKISHPFQARRRGTQTVNILFYAPLGTRVPLQLARTLAALPHPWKVQRNPWYAL